jgi:hypothetical protein
MTATRFAPRILLGLFAILLALPTFAAEYRVPHDNLTLDLGFPPWNWDSGWVGVNSGGVTAQVRLNGGISGTALGLDIAGEGWLECPTEPNAGSLRFVGGPSTAEQSLGVTVAGEYRIQVPVLGINTQSNFDILQPTGLYDEEVFTAYNLGGTFTLADRIDEFKIADIPVNIGTAVTGTLGVKLSIGDRMTVNINRLQTSAGNFTQNAEVKTVATPGAQLNVNNIALVAEIEPDVSIYIIVDINLNIAGLTSIITRVNVPAIQVPLDTLLESEYATTPARSILFGIAPTLGGLAMNNGANNTISRMVNLNMTAYNGPSQFMASEDPSFAGAVWTPFTGVPQYQLSAGDGFKNVYLRVKNAYGESVIRSDSITLYANPPTVNFLGTSDTTPPLSGRVDDREATVTVSVGGQSLPAVNDGMGHWTLANDLLAPLNDATYDVVVVERDAAGNELQDTTADELIVDTIAPSVFTDDLITNNSMTPFTGLTNDPTAEIWVAIWIYNVQAINHGNGTWTLPEGSLLLLPGEYIVTATAIDPAGNTSSSSADVLVDVTDPVVKIKALVTGDVSPALTGTISEIDAVVRITIGAQTVIAENVGDGTWRVPAGVFGPFEAGTYEVMAVATDRAMNVGTDKTTNELTVDLDALAVCINALTTNDNTPALTGTVNRDTATVSVIVNGITYPALNRGDGTWVLADNTIAPLADGVYDVEAHALNGADTAEDATLNELKIDTIPPTVQISLVDPTPNSGEVVRFAFLFSEPIAPTFNLGDVRLVGDPIQIYNLTFGGTDPEWRIKIIMADPDANGRLGLELLPGTVQDAAGNLCAGALSPLYDIANWCGFAETPQDTRGYFSDTVTFRAVPECAAAFARYQWWWTPAGAKLAQPIGGDSPELTLSNLSTANLGDYWCDASFNGITHTTPPAGLILTDHLQIIEAPPTFASPPEGRPFALRVRTTGGYAPVVYEWSFEGTAIPEAESLPDGSVCEVVVDAAAEGLYRATAIDDNGDTVVAETVLVVGEPLPLKSWGLVMVIATVLGIACRANWRRTRRLRR